MAVSADDMSHTSQGRTRTGREGSYLFEAMDLTQRTEKALTFSPSGCTKKACEPLAKLKNQALLLPYSVAVQ